MEITEHTAIRSPLAVRNYDGLIMLGYVAIAIVAIAVLYIATSGTGFTEAALAIATVFPWQMTECDWPRGALLCPSLRRYAYGPWSARPKPELRACGGLRRTNC